MPERDDLYWRVMRFLDDEREAAAERLTAFIERIIEEQWEAALREKEAYTSL